MKRALSTITFTVILLSLSQTMACDSPAATADPAASAEAPATAAIEAQASTPTTQAANAPIPELPVDEVARLLEAHEAVAVDANDESIREEFGVVPNATLLTSSGRYDPAAELPSDSSTRLVFYCGNEDCCAADGAATRARDAGYADVSVMRAGIAGWKSAGRETISPPSRS